MIQAPRRAPRTPKRPIIRTKFRKIRVRNLILIIGMARVEAYTEGRWQINEVP